MREITGFFLPVHAAPAGPVDRMSLDFVRMSNICSYNEF